MSATFDLSAFDGLDDQLASAAERIERLLGPEQAKAKIKKNLDLITKDAASRVNSITGSLVKAIETRITVRFDAPTEIECGISYKRHQNARHAHLVEGGHGGPHPAPPHPFWEPAVQAHGEEAVDSLEDTLNDLIDEIFS